MSGVDGPPENSAASAVQQVVTLTQPGSLEIDAGDHSDDRHSASSSSPTDASPTRSSKDLKQPNAKSRDEYGFEVDERSAKDMETFQQHYGPVLERRAKKWDGLLKSKKNSKKNSTKNIFARITSLPASFPAASSLSSPLNRGRSNSAEIIKCVTCGLSVATRDVDTHECKAETVADLKKSETLKRYVRKGVPKDLRPDVWMHVSGAHTLIQAQPNLYAQLREQELADKSMKFQIQKDLHRTFPDNEAFLCNYDEETDQRTDIKERIIQMQHVLEAFCITHPKNGYCQGLNFLTGMLLIVTNDEEQTFWLLKQLTECILPDYYSHDMFAMTVDQQVIDRLVQQKMPALHRHLEDNGVSIALISTKWFICLFADVLPTETVLRIWDSLFYEGPKIIFRVAVALFKRHEANLMKFNDPGACYEYAKAMPSKEIDCHDLMVNGVFNPKVVGSFSMKTIAKFRADITNELRPKSRRPSIQGAVNAVRRLSSGK